MCCVREKKDKAKNNKVGALTSCLRRRGNWQKFCQSDIIKLKHMAHKIWRLWCHKTSKKEKLNQKVKHG